MSEATYVPILPDLSTFFKETSKGAKSAGQQAGRDFADGMTREVKKAERAVETATKAQERASARAEDATAKRRLEEQKLNEVLEKGTAKVSEIMAATQRYEKAQRDEAQATKNAEKANTDLIKRKQDLSKVSDEAAGAVRVGADEIDDLGESALGAAGKIGDLVGASEGIGSKLMGGLKTIGTGALLGVGAKIGSTITDGIGTAFSAGFSRLQSVEQAEKMLQGLGHSTEATANILDNAMESVKGTAFGFGEAASMAATFVGAGIPEGEELTRVLTLVGDSAAIAGADFQEMGSIWTKVASGQRMGTEELNQLMDRGLGLLPELQKKYGVTAEEARKMITDGKVSFEDFADVMENMVGGSAQSMGETFGGSLSNMQAALGRLGAKFLEPVFENAPAIFSAVGGAVDTLGEKLDPLIASWSERMQPVFEQFADWIGPALEKSIEGIADGLAAMVGWVKDNATWLKPLVAAAAGAATAYAAWTVATNAHTVATWAWTKATQVATAAQRIFNAVVNANKLMLIVTAIGAVVGALVYFFTQTETGRELWGKFTTALSDGWNWVVEKVTAGWEWLKTTVFDAWTNTVAAVQAHWNLATNALAFAWAWVKDQFVTTWSAVKTGVFDAWNTVVGGVKATWDTITGALNSAWAWTKDQFVYVWTVVKATVFDAWNTAVETVRSVFSTVTAKLSESWTWLKDNLVTTWTTVKTTVFDAMTSALDTVKGWFSTTVDAIGTTWDKLRALTAKPVRFVVETVYGGIRNAWNKVAGLVGLGELPEVPLGNLGAYARGGVLPGYTPGRDVHEFYSPTGGRIHLSGGEAIMRPEWVRAVGGPSAVDEMNRAAREGKTLAAGPHDHYALGGVWDLGAFANGGTLRKNPGVVLTTDIQRSMERAVAAAFPNQIITSATRYQEMGSGYDNHMAGRALDFAASHALADWIARTYPHSAELFWDPGPNLKNGRPTGAIGGHSDHVHWAMASMVDPYTGEVVSQDGPGGGGGFSLLGMAKGMWDKAIGAIGKFPGAETMGTIGKLPAAALSTLATGAWNFLKEKFAAVGSFFGGGGGGEQYRGQIEAAFRNQGEVPHKHLVDALVRQIDTESGGDPNIAQQIVDVNGTGPSAGLGLYQFIPSTFAAYRDPSLPNDRTDPWAAHNAAVRYFRDRHNWNTGPGGVGRGHGWKSGGVLPADLTTLFDTGGVWKHGTAGVNLSGADEYVFTNKAMRDFQLATESLAVAGKEISTAYNGGDWGYAELARILGREDWAQAIIAGTRRLGEIHRAVDAGVDAANAVWADQAPGQDDWIQAGWDFLGMGDSLTAGLIRKGAEFNALVADYEADMAEADVDDPDVPPVDDEVTVSEPVTVDAPAIEVPSVADTTSDDSGPVATAGGAGDSGLTVVINLDGVEAVRERIEKVEDGVVEIDKELDALKAERRALDVAANVLLS